MFRRFFLENSFRDHGVESGFAKVVNPVLKREQAHVEDRIDLFLRNDGLAIDHGEDVITAAGGPTKRYVAAGDSAEDHKEGIGRGEMFTFHRCQPFDV